MEILKQTGPVVRLKAARHVNPRLNRTQTSSMSPQSSTGLVETAPAGAQAEAVAMEPKKGNTVPQVTHTNCSLAFFYGG